MVDKKYGNGFANRSACELSDFVLWYIIFGISSIFLINVKLELET